MDGKMLDMPVWVYVVYAFVYVGIPAIIVFEVLHRLVIGAW